jgi:hypothetical protein
MVYRTNGARITDARSMAMNRALRSGLRRRTLATLLVVAGFGALAAPRPGRAQESTAPAPQPLTSRQAAVIDVTGYWVSIVDEDWRWRMLTAPIGDVASIPVNAEGRRVAKQWDPAADQAAGAACKGYGAAGLMRLPLRLHIHWTDGQSLAIDTDAGQQQRLLHFQGQWDGKAALQGYSAASWFKQVQQSGFGKPYGGAEPGKGGSLKVITTHMTPGYLRTNGVPYSADATLIEYFDRIEDEGTTYLILTSIVIDPTYLQDQYVTSYEFKLEPDGSKWHPQPCRIVPPTR